MPSRSVLAVAIGLWTLLAWGGRVRLLADAEQADVGNWVRIGGSLLVGAVAIVVMLVSANTAWEQ